jgi:AraC family transcriptional regulator
MNLYIKNMVCDRCKMVVTDIFKQINILPISIGLGEVIIQEDLSEEQENTLSVRLRQVGFELLSDKRFQTVEKVKTTIIELVNEHPEILRKYNPSVYISEKVGREYKYLTTIFSEIEGSTIEQFLICQKIEKVKELLTYDELSLSQISDALQYSSVQHLSIQFKKITGFTTTHFKELQKQKYSFQNS